MLKRIIIVGCMAAGSAHALFAQAIPTATRRADFQVGVGYVRADSDYILNALNGVALYTTLDFTSHLGGEFVIHQANSSAGDKVYERTYEVGPRYYRDYGRFSPYVKAMYGRGVFNFPNDIANLAYNLFAAGVGVDIHVLPWLNVRADYEYQRWLSFPPNGLTPQVVTIGVAYHFPGALSKGRHY